MLPLKSKAVVAVQSVVSSVVSVGSLATIQPLFVLCSSRTLRRCPKRPLDIRPLRMGQQRCPEILSTNKRWDAVSQNGEILPLHRQYVNTLSHYCFSFFFFFSIANKQKIFKILPISLPSHVCNSFCHQNPGCISLLPLACYVRTSSPWFVRRKIWWTYRPWCFSSLNGLKLPVSACVLPSDVLMHNVKYV